MKKGIAVLLIVILAFGMVTINAENDVSQKTVEASYGTPIIDGEIDDIWNTTNYTFIDRLTPSGDYSYTGWIKTLWDEDKLYVLGKIHTVALSADSTVSAWKHDCVEIFIDENCGRTTTCEDDDYQLRSNFEAATSTKNYPVADLEAATTTFDMGYVVEMAFPMKSVTLANGLTMGFDAQVYRTGNFAFDAARYGWSAIRSDISSSTVDYGTITLKNTVNVETPNIPTYTPPAITDFSILKIPESGELKLISGVSAMYDYGVEHNVSVLHVNEYPCIEINTLGQIIGATVENGDTLVKDGIHVKYTAEERLLQDNNGNIMMQCEATNYNGNLYVPLSSMETTFMYNIEYNRFANELDIIPFHEPATAEFVANVKDYGAVGDGVHDDKEAILAAFNAAVTSGKPSRVELEAGKKYYVSETMDNWHMFWIAGVQDFVFDGNGSTLLFPPSQGSAFSIGKSARVRIEDLIIDSTEPMSTQGWIRGKNENEGYLVVEFEEGYTALVPEAWAKAHSQTNNYLCPIQAGTSHSKYVYMDYAEISGMEHIEGRLYKVKMATGGVGMIPLVEEGDKFVMNYTFQNYDLNRWSKSQWDSGMFHIGTSGDVELRNITTRAGKFLGLSVVNSWGNIKLNNFSAYNEDGSLWSNGRDYIHTAYGRGTLLFENSTVIGCGDDFINTKSGETEFVENLGDRRWRMQNNACYVQGDEVIVFDTVKKVILGRAFVEEVEYVTTALNSETAEIKLDRDIEGIKASSELESGETATISYNVSAAFSGTVVRNNVLKNGKRWAWVNRSPNCVFENNYSENMNGSMVAAENETKTNEGPFPSAFTIRNNNYYCDGNGVPTSDPIEVKSYGASIDATAAVDGILIEGNTLETSRVGTVISVADVNDLYMINNKIINHGENGLKNMPITIKNSTISLVDGVTLDYKNNVNYGVNIAGCEYDVNNIKNINILGDNTMGPYKDWWK